MTVNSLDNLISFLVIGHYVHEPCWWLDFWNVLFSGNLTIANLWHTATRICNWAELEFRFCWLNLWSLMTFTSRWLMPQLLISQFRQNFKTTETFMWKELNEAVDSKKRIEDSFKDSPWSFSQNIVNGWNPLTTFAKKFLSEMFERVLNILLVTACLCPLKICYCHQLTKNDRKKIVKEISIKIIKSIKAIINQKKPTFHAKCKFCIILIY